MGFNLAIGFWDMFWPQFLQGVSMGLVVVPLMVVTMAFISKEKDGERYELVQHDAEHRRGSGHFVGANHADPHGAGAHQLAGRQYHAALPFGAPVVGGLRGLFAGSGPGWADQQAYATLFGLVQREATMVALVRVFQYLGVLVLIMIPLIALTKRPPKGQTAQPMAH